MRLILDKMRISNFKGIRELEINFDEKVTRVFGMNGTGKTTLADAFCWCLWNKNSNGDAPGSDAFRDKPLDDEGNEIHNLDTTVELFCKLEGQAFNLKRTQRENWVKKRGFTELVYQGNVSTYWINDVETKLADFRARIGQITSEDVFRLIASLSAFNALDWKKRREQLIALSDGDVDYKLLSRPEFRPLADEASQRNISIDDLRKVLADQRKRTNDELKMIPVRIDEARKALPDITEREIRDAEYIIKESSEDVERIDGYITEAKAQAGASTDRMAILALEQELVSIKRRMSDEHAALRREFQRNADLASKTFRNESAGLVDAKRRLEEINSRLEKKITERDKLRVRFAEVRDTPVKTAESVCPYCGQDLPEDRVARANEKLAFEKREELNQIKQMGKAVAGEVAQIEEDMRSIKDGVSEAEKRAAAAMTERDAEYKKLDDFPEFPDFDAEPRIAELSEKIDNAKAGMKSSPDEKIREFEDRKRELQRIIDKNRAVLVMRDAGRDTEKRIAELEESQKEAGARISRIEQLIALCEKFVQDRCGALEESINAKFPTVRWKLFDVQINGGIVDCCMCMIPCDSGLVAYESANTASQVNADVEIVNVLSEYYDIRLPLFVDNSERVNVLAPTDSQLITLSVSTDSELKVVY